MKVLVHQCQYQKGFPMNSLSLLIMIFQGMFKRPKYRRYTHYSLELVKKNPEIYESIVYGGVDSKPKDRWLKNYKIVTSYAYDLPSFSDAHFENWFYMHDGKSYAKKQLIGIVLQVFNFIKENPFGKGASRLICSELVILFLNRFVEVVTGRDFTDSLDLVDTEQILDEHSKRGLCSKIVFP